MPITSTNMALSIPIFRDPSPGYVNSIQQSLSTLDTHNHTPGKGVAVPTNGININADLTFNSNNAIGLRSTIFSNNQTTLQQATDQYSVYVANGNLYFNFGLAPVQITAGNSLNAALLGGFGGNYTASGANAYFDNTTPPGVYDFYGSGGSQLANIQAAKLLLAATTPYVDYTDTNSGKTKFRHGTNDLILWALSIDANNSGNTDTYKRYSAIPNALSVGVPVGTTSSTIAGVGVNCVAADAVLQVQSTGIATTAPANIAHFTNTSAAAVSVLQGVSVSGAAAASQTLSDGTRTASMTLQNTTGGYGAGDLSVGTAANYVVMKQTGVGVAINKATAGDALDVNGDIRATGGFRQVIGPMMVAGSFNNSTLYYFAAAATNGVNGTTANAQFSLCPIYLPYAGSVVGLSLSVGNSSGSGSGGVTYTAAVQQNGSTVVAIAVNSPNGTNYAAYPKDTYPITAGNILSFAFSVSGTVANTQATLAVWIEC